VETKVVNKPSTYGWHVVPGEGKSLREEWIDSGSESGMTQDCHAEVAEPQPNRSMQNLNCHPELVSGSSHCEDEGSPLTPTLSRRARGICAAFTLAEVLITLAIIGVVAAMTIPTLTQNYKKKVVETKLAKFNSVMQQALSLSVVENGDYFTWDGFQNEIIKDDSGDILYYKSVNTLEWYNKYIAPYIKVAKVEPDITNEGSLGIYFHDGGLLLLSWSSCIFYPNAADFKTKLHDITGEPEKDVSISGTKYFTFYMVLTPSVARGHNGRYGLRPYLDSSFDGTKESLINNPAIGCSPDATGERAFCTKLIEMNGWKIPNDYPLKF